MLKKILFLLSALFFCMNIFSSEVVLQTLKWLDYNIPQEIAFKIIFYCDLADFGNCKSVCKHFNNFDLNALICPTHKENNHECSSIHLSDLTKDYDRCTHILHCIASRKNEKNLFLFNSKSEKNLFNMIYFLHKQKRDQLIEKIHPTVKQELFSNKLRRDYYQYTESNTKDMLRNAIHKNEVIRIKQILHSSNQYIEGIITTFDFSLINIINNIVCFPNSAIESQNLIGRQNMIELLLSADNDINTTDQHNLWQEIVLTAYQYSHKIKDALIDFLLSKKFNHLNPYFSADFYIKENGFLSICSKSDFDLISDRCDQNAIFDPEKIKCMDNVCKIKDFNFSIKIAKWLISKNVNFNEIDNCRLCEAYDINNIKLVKLLLNQGAYYGPLLFKICQQNDIDLATWILDNRNKNNKFIYNDDFIYAACDCLNVTMVQLLFTKKKIVNFYKPISFQKNYSELTPLFQKILQNGANKTPEFSYKKNTYNDACCKIIKLFLENGFDVNKQIKDTKNYNYPESATYFSYYIKENKQLAALLPSSNLTNIEKYPTNNKSLNIFIWTYSILQWCYYSLLGMLRIVPSSI